MPNNKKHHYVPQFYLRNFGVGHSISLFNIQQRRHIARAPISGQCQRAYLYGGDNKKEAELAKLEGAACAVIRSIITSATPPTSGSDAHRALAEYLSIQLGRTPDAASALQLSHDKFYRGFAKEFARRNGFSEQAVEGIQPPDDLDPQRTSLDISERQGAMLLDLEMRLLQASDRAFITSDLPVVLYNQWSRHYKASGVRGLTCSGLLVLLPICPRMCVLLFDGEVYAVPKRSTAILVDGADITSINAAQLLGAESNLYYFDDPATRSQIDTLPLHWVRPRTELVRVQRARSDEDGSALFFFFEEQPDVSLKFRFLRQTGRAKRVPNLERGRRWRQAAIAEAARIGIEESQERRSYVKPGTTWRVIDDE